MSDREKKEKPGVFWAVLMERALLGHAVDAVIDVAMLAAIRKYTRISVPYMRTDMARNRIVSSFMEVSKNPDDVIVMLDGDHIHPPNVIEQLVCYDPEQIGVIGALYYRRGEPYDPLFFVRHGDKLRNPAEFSDGLVYECTIVATGAIAIRRWVFEELEEAGLGMPFFQYTYPEDHAFSMTEDVFFGLQCEKAGIPHYVDTSVKTPHLTITSITQNDWEAYKADHPEMITEDIGEQPEKQQEES